MKSADVLSCDGGCKVGLTKNKVFFIDARGAPGLTSIGDDFSTAESLASRIRENSLANDMLHKANKVELISCYVADDVEGGAQAQRLAGQLQKPVIGYFGQLTIWAGFGYDAAFKKISDTGSRSVLTRRKPSVVATDDRLFYLRKRLFNP